MGSELRGGHVGLKLGGEVGHERAWLHDAVEILVAGEEGVDEHDERLPAIHWLHAIILYTLEARVRRPKESMFADPSAFETAFAGVSFDEVTTHSEE